MILTAIYGLRQAQNGPFSLLLVVHATIPTGPRRRPPAKTPKNTPQDGLPTRDSRLTGVGEGVRGLARVGAPTSLLPPIPPLCGETLSGVCGPDRKPGP